MLCIFMRMCACVCVNVGRGKERAKDREVMERGVVSKLDIYLFVYKEVYLGIFIFLFF